MNYILPLITFLVVLIAFQLVRPKKKRQLSDEQKKKIPDNSNKENEKWKLEMENDKERITNDDIARLIPTLNLSPNVLELFQGNCNDEILKRHFFDKDYADPYMVLTLQKDQQQVYLIDRYKPILAYASSTIFAYDSKLKGYISYDIESDVEPSRECLTWDGLFVSEILRWWEYEVGYEDILYIGSFFGLKHTKQILDSINNTTNGNGFSTGAALSLWQNAMIEKINCLVKREPKLK